jgi:hypothetical protein
MIEAGALCFGRLAIIRQVAMCEEKSQDTQWQVDQKDARHPSPAIRMPPSDGPSAVPIADIVPSSPMALPVFALGTVSPTNAMVRAIMMAAPRPCSARAAISNQSVGATPHRLDATVNRKIPANSSRLRPVMSPSRPTLTIRVVMARR